MTTVLLLSSLDTREEETLLLKNLIQQNGCRVILMDISMGSCKEGVADYSAADVANEAGASFEEISASRDTNRNTDLLVRGATKLTQKLYGDGEIDGIAGLGGTSNTTLISLVMKEFPFGFPKLILSSSAAVPAYATKFIANRDVVMFYSCVEVNTLNRFVNDVLSRFAGLIVGVLKTGGKGVAQNGTAIGLSEFKFSERCTARVRDRIRQKGFEIIPFSATGASDRIMEDMASSGLFQGILDLVPSGFSEALLGGNRSAGFDRLDRELSLGIPIIFTPCGFDMISCGPYERRFHDLYWKRKRIANRKLFIPDTYRVQARTTKKEMELIARVFSEKLDKAKSRVAVFIPLRGFSSLSIKGGPLYDPQADMVFIKTLRNTINKDAVEVVEMECTIEDPEFADAIVDRFVTKISLPSTPDPVIA
ncbi:MAG: hypothetical protein A4E63_00138 [Syntrophorhabdus sp. PtaU1.Bin050]|nr:MAG: hypothetical protein A4E63_00138 [Syntrophorhabdus sp. PtaU1.Bin050]